MFRSFAKLTLAAILLATPLMTLTASADGLAEESTPVFLVDEDGSLVFTDLWFVDRESADAVAVPADACNGGTCTTDNGTILECPKSGGPTCKDDEECICKCIENDDETWSAVNRCIKRADG